MCATFNVSESTLKRYLDEFADFHELRPSGDVFPSDNFAVLTEKRPVPCKWGFTRYDNKGVIINARAETVTQKQIFTGCFLARRCVIPADGFYEWDKNKRKFYFMRKDGAPLFLCGFYRAENDCNRFIVLTKPATSPVDEYHDRIPVIADESQIDNYLGDREFARGFILRDSPIALNVTA